MSLRLTTFSPSMVYANCYILKDEASGEALVVDPGAYNQRFENMLRQEGITSLKYILLTHGHFDHFMAAEKLKEKTGAPIYISEEDSEKLSDYRKSLYDIMGVGSDGFISAGPDFFLAETVELCNNKFEVIKTPGHSEGSVCLLFDKILFSGDTLFKRSIGRYDRGSYDHLMRSLWNLMLLDDDITVLPGHGEATTIGDERAGNPFLM